MREIGVKEPSTVLWDRIDELLKELKRNYADQTILVITHGGVLDALVAKSFFFASSSSMTTLVHHTGISHFKITTQVEMVYHNSTLHLSDSLRTY